ncbi:MAG TPA: glycosyltransferase family 4 protein [Terriglobales bacterium]|nr:glycosyltransferase family 4 protein [Terriglobales bacterium]
MPFDVVMLTSAHAALDDRIFYREAKTLNEAGHSVCVAGKHPSSEVVDGIQICAIKAARTRTQRLWLGISILKRALELDGRVFIIHDPELIAVALILRASGKRVVYDAHENLPAQIQQKNWIPKPIRSLLIPLARATEWIASRALNGIIAAVPAIQARFPAKKTVLVRNFPTPAALETLGEGAEFSARRDVVIYTGGLSRVRGTTELVEAFRGLASAELWLVGDFDDSTFCDEVVSNLPINVKWMGWKAHTDVLRLYREAKLGLVLLHSTPNHRCALPVKLFEYLGAGLPVIASNFQEYQSLVQGCGICVDPMNVGEIRRAITTLLSDESMLRQMSLQARKRALTEFSWAGEGKRLVEFCSKLMTPTTGDHIALRESPGPINS